MASATTTTLAEAIRQVINPAVEEGIFFNNDLIPLFPRVMSGGDSTYDWQIHSGTNASTATYSEGDNAPAAGSQDYTTLSLAWTYIHATVEITGHLRDALKTNNSRFFDAIPMEFEHARNEMVDLFTTTFLNDSSVGLQAGIDDNNTYAGQARGSATWFESAVESSIGALALADFVNVTEELQNPEHGSAVDFWLAPPNQISNYASLNNIMATSQRLNVNENTGAFDLGFNREALSAMGAPIIPVRDLTNTVILGVSRRSNIVVVEHRGLQIEELGKTKDTDKFLLTMAMAMPVRNPVKSAKMEGITA